MFMCAVVVELHSCSGKMLLSRAGKGCYDLGHGLLEELCIKSAELLVGYLHGKPGKQQTLCPKIPCFTVMILPTVCTY